MRTIEISGLRKAFGSVHAVNGVDLQVAPGEHIALLGPSGSGKSTLLRLLAGLENPDQGDVLFDGASQLGIEPHRRDVALVFQQYALYPHLTALGNISLGLRHGLRMPRRAAEARAREVARRLEIEHLLDRHPRAMSGGQRQRVSLARAMARRAGVVLLDEPMSGLDAQLRLTLRVEVGQHLRESGATVVHVTHDQSDAMATADRVAVIEDGAIRQLGTADELYARPTNRFVARFIGTPPMNLFELDEAGRSAFGAHQTNSTVSAARPTTGSGACLGIRPEHLVLGTDRPWKAVGRVLSSELAGPDHVLYLDLAGKVVAVRTPERPPTIGTMVPLTCDPADAHVFTGVDGERIGAANTAAPLMSTSVPVPV